MTTTLSLVFNDLVTPRIHGLADFKEATVGVQAATTDYDVPAAMQKRGEIKNVKVYLFDRIADAVTDLSAGAYARTTLASPPQSMPHWRR